MNIADLFLVSISAGEERLVQVCQRSLPPVYSCKSIACFLTQRKVLFLGREQQTSSMQCKDTLLYICLFYSCLVFYFIFSLYIKINKLFLKMLSLSLFCYISTRAQPISSVAIGILQTSHHWLICSPICANIKTVLKAGKNAWTSDLK